jgi:hypothetical protein
MVTQALTQPFHLVKIAKIPKPTNRFQEGLMIRFSRQSLCGSYSTNFQERFTRDGPIDGGRLRRAESPELMHRSISAKGAWL